MAGFGPATSFPQAPSGGNVSYSGPSSTVQAARDRRVDKAKDRNVRIEWFIKEVSEKIELAMRERMEMATEYLKNKVVLNLSTPVLKGIGPRGGRVVTGRSSSGEYPHMETAQLIKSIFGELVEVSPGVFEGYVGTNLDYGAILETKMDRSFLVRTLGEVLGDLKAILAGPIKG